MKHTRTHYILYALLPLLALAGCSENEAPGTFEPQLEVLPQEWNALAPTCTA